jgi:hypothetical protein
MSIMALLIKLSRIKTTGEKGDTYNWQLAGPKGTLTDPSYKKMSLAT